MRYVHALVLCLVVLFSVGCRTAGPQIISPIVTTQQNFSECTYRTVAVIVENRTGRSMNDGAHPPCQHS